MYFSILCLLSVLTPPLLARADNPICVQQSLPKIIPADSTWEQLANPNLSDPNPKTYTYLIHALPSRLNLQRILNAEKEGGMEVSHALDLVTHPELISLKKKISTSVITEKSHRTFEERGFGYIMKAHLENIVATRNADMGSAVTVRPNQIEEFYAIMADKYPVQTPAAMSNDPSKMNEVLLRGTSKSGKKVEIGAIWVFVDTQGHLNLNPSELEDLNYLKEKLKLPVIQLSEGNNRLRMILDSNK